jgi:hypothetical protein
MMSIAHVCSWHKADLSKRHSDVRFRSHNRRQMLNASFSAFDPKGEVAQAGFAQ